MFAYLHTFKIFTQTLELKTIRFYSKYRVCPANRVDFHNVCCFFPTPQLPGNLAESLALNKVETTDMADMFQRIEAIYI